ncbi:GNAT family N-acetyltransferase [Peribacillus sp. SCS-155]|uniref:GNAT family N-acetyltransferase n=1 Tax=Peribacillus sedimenti TaxID=3115297 RepID=UPI00390596B8
MIGEQFQGKGYGKQAMQQIMDMNAKHEDCERIRLSVVTENQSAISFYKKIGFVETDETLHDENIMDYFLPGG